MKSHVGVEASVQRRDCPEGQRKKQLIKGQVCLRTGLSSKGLSYLCLQNFKVYVKSLFIELCFVCGGRLDVYAASFVYLFPASVEELTISLIVYFHALSKV